MAKFTFEINAPFEKPQNSLELASMLHQIIKQLPGYSHSTEEQAHQDALDEAHLPGVAFKYDDGSLRGFYVDVTLAFE